MKYFKAFVAWLIILPIAILNGGFREYVLSELGIIAMPLSGIILSVCIFIIAYLLILINRSINDFRENTSNLIIYTICNMINPFYIHSKKNLFF